MKKNNTISRTALLASLEVIVEEHIRVAVSLFQNMTAEDLLRPSSSGGWSIAQCLEHLNSYGKFYLPEIKKGLDKVEHTSDVEEFSSTWLGRYFTKIMDPTTGKKRYKALKNHIPPANLNAHAVIAEFLNQQETLLSYLRKAYRVDLNKVTVPLSIFQWISFRLGDAFMFLIAHNERHVLQAKRNTSPIHVQ